jgi:hypothetical protein
MKSCAFSVLLILLCHNLFGQANYEHLVRILNAAVTNESFDSCDLPIIVIVENDPIFEKNDTKLIYKNDSNEVFVLMTRDAVFFYGVKRAFSIFSLSVGENNEEISLCLRRPLPRTLEKEVYEIIISLNNSNNIVKVKISRKE